MRYFLILVAILTLSIGFIACSCNTVTLPNQQPIEVVSVKAVGPVNPGGPTIKITLRNVSNEPVISVKCILQLDGERTYEYNFPDVTLAAPLQPNNITSQTLNLVGPTGYSDEVFYPLTIYVTFLGGNTFTYIKQIQVE